MTEPRLNGTHYCDDSECTATMPDDGEAGGWTVWRSEQRTSLFCPDCTEWSRGERDGHDPAHPHEPEVVPVYDFEGNCLACRFTESQRQSARARKAVSALSKQLVETGAEASRTRSARFHDLLAYSEWLDQQDLIYETPRPDEYRTHEDLVGEYLGHKVCTKHDYGIDANCTCGGTR